MTDLPASGYWSDNNRTEGEQKQWGEDIRDFLNQMPGGGLEETVTISSGSVTPTRGIIAVDTEGGTASDTLDVISQANLPEGSLILVRAANASRTVTVTHNSGSNGAVLLKSGANEDFAADQFLWLKRTGTTWEEVSQKDTALGTAATKDVGQLSLIGLQTFTTDGTYTATSGTQQVLVVVTAGGGGGGYAKGGVSPQAAAGTGGGAGGTAIKYITSGFSGVSVTVGSGGSGGDGPTNTVATDGGGSSFGSFCSAAGGSAGAFANSQGGWATVVPRDGGVGSNGDINLRGGQGGASWMNGNASVAMAGNGGSSYWAAGSAGQIDGSVPSVQSDKVYGAGGGGGATTSTTDRDGGDGGDGIVVVYEYG